VGLLTGGWDEARAIGAGGVAADLERLGRRARVPLGDALPRAGGVRARLTRREREILDLVAAGASNREVATTLFISEKTVSVHMSNLMAKLGVPNRREASALVLAERGEP
jgi:DNA-binding CsgD family transcriptional regulator